MPPHSPDRCELQCILPPLGLPGNHEPWSRLGTIVGGSCCKRSCASERARRVWRNTIKQRRSLASGFLEQAYASGRLLKELTRPSQFGSSLVALARPREIRTPT